MPSLQTDTLNMSINTAVLKPSSLACIPSNSWWLTEHSRCLRAGLGIAIPMQKHIFIFWNKLRYLRIENFHFYHFSIEIKSMVIQKTEHIIVISVYVTH